MNRPTIDPITLEIWWSRLVAIADEAATTLVRTAFSTIIRQSNDYTGIADRFRRNDRRVSCRSTGFRGDSGCDHPECIGQVSRGRTADMRYIGQSFEIEVPLPADALGGPADDRIREAFIHTYAGLFEQAVEDVPVEVINWRLSARLPGHCHSLAVAPAVSPTTREERRIHFAGHGDLAAAVYDRYALRPGTTIHGPAAFEERESTFIVGPECVVTVDDHFNLIADLTSEHEGPAKW